MHYLPIFASLTGQPCLVVGGGAVAGRKVEQLLAAGARVTVNAPEVQPELAAAAADGRITVVLRPFDAALIPLHLLVIAATNDRAVNHAVATTAQKSLRLCNVVDDPELSSYISPSIVDRSPLLVAVSSGGRAPVLARLVRQQLEAWLPARLGVLATWAGSWRERVKARLPDLSRRRRLWEQALAGALDARAGVANDVLNGRLAAADAAMTAALRAGELEATAATAGEAWLVGAGPGEPELLTLRGLYLLQHADVVLYDRLVAPALLAYARRDAELINVGKTGGGASTSQAAINALLVDRVRAGQRVCRLKGGDPYVFGRGSEEGLALAAAGLRFQVIPGITAASGCGAYAGIPLTHRHAAHAVTFVTAHLGAGDEPDAGTGPTPDWQRLAELGQTLVVYMTGRRLQAVTAALLQHGRSAATPAAVVVAGTTNDQLCVVGTLGDIAHRASAAGLTSPAILYVGEVVGLRSHLDWFSPAAPDAAYNEQRSGVLP